MIKVDINPTLFMGDNQPLSIIAGPCVIENESLCLQIAEKLVDVCNRLKANFIFKASFDKANRTSVESYRGPGMDRGLKILKTVKEQFSVPILTDIHEISQVGPVSEVAEILQIPAFLCRQTDLLLAAGKSERVVNIKKGQFMAPQDMENVVEKVTSTGNSKILLTERGYTFGYNNLVVDMRSLAIMRTLGFPVIFDATHSVQLPGGLGKASGGERKFVPPLSRAATAVGIDGLFLETHPNPLQAKSDGANSIPLDAIENIISQSVLIHELVGKSIPN